MYNVYILECSDNSLYTGYTSDIEKRLNEHNTKKGAKCLMGKLPVKLVYIKEYQSKSEAMRREAEIKSWPRIKKLNLLKK